VAHTVRRRNAYGLLVRKPEEKRPPKDLDVDGRLLKLTLKKQDCIILAHFRNDCETFVNKVLNLRVA
jgi:hypothetical protein